MTARPDATARGPRSGEARASAERSTGASIDWAALHRTTRLAPTVTTFGWRAKVALSAPPPLVLGWWTATGAFFDGAIALGLGVPMLAASVWWLRQVWVAGPDATAERRATGTAPAAGVEPAARPMHPAMAYLYEAGPDVRPADRWSAGPGSTSGRSPGPG